MTVYEKTGGARRYIQRAYLDTCLLSGYVENDLREPESMALLRLLRAHGDGRIVVVTSHVALEELARISDEAKRARHEAFYALLADVPAVEEASTDSGLSLMGVGRGRRDVAEFSTLKAILPDLDDARHVFQAVRNGVDYFVTDDERTIVSRRPQVEMELPIMIRLPSEVVAELAL